VLLIGGAVLLVLALAWGIWFYFYARAHESTDDAFIEGHVIPISPKVAGQVLHVFIDDNQEVVKGQLLVQIDPRDFEVKLAQDQAALAAARSQQQSAQIQVDLTRVTSTAGVSQASSGVQLGQSGVATAQAQAAAAQSQIGQAQASVQAARAERERARADVNASRAKAEKAHADLKRFQELFKENVVSQQQLDQVATDARTANATLAADEERVRSAEAQIKQAEATEQAAGDALRQARSQVNEARARAGQATGKLEEVNVTPQRVANSQSQLETAKAEAQRLEAVIEQDKLNLGYSRIIAPEAGRITRKNVEPGAYLQVGQQLLALVPSEVWVVANYKETQLTHMRPGQPVGIKVDAYPGVVFHGHVDSIQSGTGARFSLLPPENATGNYIKVVQRVPVKIVFDQPPDPAHRLVPGMSVVPTVKIR
jgi:membrane fusion protein (multidrug efflux system)